MKKATIHWFPQSEGGRTAPPAAAEYYPTTEVQEDGSIWSLTIRFDRSNPPQDGMVAHCEVCFLFDHAPQHSLHHGA